ncbi:Hypothetical predicted protein [Pelobates cultripes]|uniref:Zona pellucida sperm-binding protein 4 n=1 Tax=Pelobates cultripes TaxID=61616 RepID=A0AAD1WSF4_PELCU|nr:Hypothetical predicted protein [Pelobates cultripes]
METGDEINVRRIKVYATIRRVDEFGMGYTISGCLASCLLSSRDVNGEIVFYSPYNVCLSARKGSIWKLRLRLFGTKKTEDLDLVCPKPKIIKPRVISRTQKPKTFRNASVSVVPSNLAGPTNQTLFLNTIVTGETVTLGRTISHQEKTPKELSSSGLSQLKTEILPTQNPQWSLTTKSVAYVTDAGMVSSMHLTHKMPAVSTLQTGNMGLLSSAQCLVSSEKVPCLDITASHDRCIHSRCCYDPQDARTPCYHGHTVSLQCYSDGRFRLVISRHVTHPPLVLASVVLRPSGCPSLTFRNGQFLEFRGHLEQCSTHRFLEGKLVYEFSLLASQNILFSSKGSITRDTTVTLLSWCTYPSTVSKSLVPVVESPVPVASVTKISALNLELRISKDFSYTSFFSPLDFPLRVPLANLIFLEVQLLHPYDPRLHLHLHDCWGAPTLNPTSEVQWPLLHNGCPFAGDDKVTQLLPVPYPPNRQRFAVYAFSFLGHPNKTQVYFFCSVSVCLPSFSNPCHSNCNTLSRSQRSQSDVSLHLVNSPGPLIIQQETRKYSANNKSRLSINIFLVFFYSAVLYLVSHA